MSQQRRSLELKHRDKTKQRIIDQRVSQRSTKRTGAVRAEAAAGRAPNGARRRGRAADGTAGRRPAAAELAVHLASMT